VPESPGTIRSSEGFASICLPDMHEGCDKAKKGGDREKERGKKKNCQNGSGCRKLSYSTQLVRPCPFGPVLRKGSRKDKQGRPASVYGEYIGRGEKTGEASVYVLS